MYLYLSGKETIWRNTIIEWCKDNDVKFFDPSIIEINHTYDKQICIAQNKYYLEKCNILIVDLNHIRDSEVTQWEMCYASLKGTPIIEFGDPSQSSHINFKISYSCKDISDVKKLLTSMLNK